MTRRSRKFRCTAADLLDIESALNSGRVIAYDPDADTPRDVGEGEPEPWPFTESVDEVLADAMRNAALLAEQLRRYRGAFEQAVKPSDRAWYLRQQGLP